MAHGRIGGQSVSEVVIYMEGGGSGRGTKGALRRGMDTFLAELKNTAQERSWRWKLVCCGDRDRAFKAFKDAQKHADDATVLLLVDAEGPVAGAHRHHLFVQDGWDLQGVDDDAVHLMTQTMETWIVADPDALDAYYGRDFHANVLPNARNLETVAKADVAQALKRATESTKKGAYHKTRHASYLLKRIDARKVRQRCPGCDQLFGVLRQAMATGGARENGRSQRR